MKVYRITLKDNCGEPFVVTVTATLRRIGISQITA